MKTFVVALAIGCLASVGPSIAFAQSGPADSKGQAGGASAAGSTNPAGKKSPMNPDSAPAADATGGSMKAKTGKHPVEGASGAPTPQMGDHHQPTTGAGK